MNEAIDEIEIESEPEAVANVEEPVSDVSPEAPLALAIIRGENLTELPMDLYIPPDALRVFLESFQGPLDLLLYLIKRQNIDILDIPVAKITQQYISYVELMHEMNFELAAEYLVMAAMLAEIKSRMLLPRSEEHEEGEIEDPRAELIRRLQEYERFKQAAVDLDSLTWVDRDVFEVSVSSDHIEAPKPPPVVEMRELLLALVKVFERAKLNAHHHIHREALSLRDRMGQVLDRIKPDTFTPFADLFGYDEGKAGVVVTFIAILELLRQNLVEMVQAEAFAPIHVKAVNLTR